MDDTSTSYIKQVGCGAVAQRGGLTWDRRNSSRATNAVWLRRPLLQVLVRQLTNGSEVVTSGARVSGVVLVKQAAHSITIGYRTDAHGQTKPAQPRKGAQAQALLSATRAWISDKFGGLDLSKCFGCLHELAYETHKSKSLARHHDTHKMGTSASVVRIPDVARLCVVALGLYLDPGVSVMVIMTKLGELPAPGMGWLPEGLERDSGSQAGFVLSYDQTRPNLPKGALVAGVCSDVSERALVCERAEENGCSQVSVTPNLLDIDKEGPLLF
jgi:hypothetical protein